jgi:hypothetical protein
MAIQNHGFTSDITDIGNKKAKYGSKRNAYFYTPDQEAKQNHVLQGLKKKKKNRKDKQQGGGGYLPTRWYYRRDLWIR